MLPSKRILVVSDLHSGSTVGLTPPAWQAGKWEFAEAPLWDWYADTVKKIGPVDVCVVNGDMVDGEGKAETIGLLTTDVEEQAEIAATALKCIKAKKMYMTYGTPFHTVGALNYEHLVADRMGCGIADTVFLEANGVKISFRHVTGASGTPYTQGTQAYKEAVRDLVQAVENDEEPADVVVRSHVHNYFRAESPERMAITTPCLQVPVSVFGRRCRSWRYHLGMVLFEVSQDGLVWVQPHIMPLKLTVKREYETV